MKSKILIILALTMTNAIASTDEVNLQLAKSNNCLACHSVDKKIVGPSFNMIAKKYQDKSKEATVTLLTEKVKNGGSGVYGVIPMPPNKNTKPEDVEKLVNWILTLK